MLVSEAAQRLGMNTQTLRLALQQDKFPFGTAIKTSPHRYTYYINSKLLDNYLKGSGYETVLNTSVTPCDCGNHDSVGSDVIQPTKGCSA